MGPAGPTPVRRRVDRRRDGSSGYGGWGVAEDHRTIRGDAAPDGSQVQLQTVKVRLAGISADGRGSLAPAVDLEIALQADLAEALRTASAVAALPADLKVKGSATGTIAVETVSDGILLTAKADLKDVHATAPGLSAPIDLPGVSPLIVRGRSLANAFRIESLSFEPPALGMLVSGDGQIGRPTARTTRSR